MNKQTIKKLLPAALSVLAAAGVLCACQQSPPTNTQAGQSDQALPVLKIGVDTLRPFFYIDENGDCAGIDAEIAAEACRRAGYQPDFIEIPWSDRDEDLQNGTVDCLWSAFIKNGREDDYLWTDPYLQSDLRAIVDAKSPDQDLSGLNSGAGMAVRAGSKIEELLLSRTDGLSPLHIYSCGTFEMAETAFVKGYTGALGGHEAVLQEVVDSYPGQYRFLDGSMLTADLAVAFRRDDDSSHCQDINAAIQEMKTDGTITDVYERYTAHLSDGEAAAHVHH